MAKGQNDAAKKIVEKYSSFCPSITCACAVAKEVKFENLKKLMQELNLRTAIGTVQMHLQKNWLTSLICRLTSQHGDLIKDFQ